MTEATRIETIGALKEASVSAKRRCVRAHLGATSIWVEVSEIAVSRMLSPFWDDCNAEDIGLTDCVGYAYNGTLYVGGSMADR